MARYLSRISTRLWLLSGLMTGITLAVGMGCIYLLIALDIHFTTERMPPKARAELEQLISTGQAGTDRYFELYDKYSGDELADSDWLVIGIIAGVSTIIGGSVALIYARRISRPITAVAQAAARVAAGDASVRVDDPGGSGETAELVYGFNKMAADLEAYSRERTVLTAGIAHELRTPLTILKGRLHGLIDGVIEPTDGEADRLLRQVEQLSRLIEDLRTLAHADAGELELDRRAIALGEIVHMAVTDLGQAAAAAGVDFKEAYAPARVHADPVRLTQVVTNLLTNAIKHSPSGGVVEVTLTIEGASALVRVSDQGPGFLAEDGARLFIPFWRARVNKAAGRPGSGLGLALAAKLVEAHGGRITAANRSDRSGAVFSIWLPLTGAGSSVGVHRVSADRP